MQANLQPTQRQPGPETASPASGETAFTAFSPLPLRPRGILELLDVSIKVYKQYLAVLMGWSTLVVTGSILASVVGLVVPFGGSVASALLTPLMTGVVACCLAAGVRGQRVEFGQCWRFTKPRFWPMVGLYLLAFLISVVALIGFGLVCALIGGLGFLLFRNASEGAQLVLAIIGGFMLLTAGTIFATVVTAWANLVPVVVCMEPDKMNSRALGRAYELIRGQWVRVCTLTTMLGLGILVLYAILWGAAALLIGLTQLKGIVSGHTIDTATWIAIIGFVLLNGVLYIIYKPIFSLIISLFYLDMRVRNEALDLEWNAHVTAPHIEALAAPPATSVQLPTGFAAANPSPPAAPYTDSFATPSVGNTTPTSLDQTPAAQISVATSPAGGEESPNMGAVESSQAPATGATANPVATDGTMPQAQTSTCPQCGAASPASYIFCMKCGTKLRAEASGPQW